MREIYSHSSEVQKPEVSAGGAWRLGGGILHLQDCQQALPFCTCCLLTFSLHVCLLSSSSKDTSHTGLEPSVIALPLLFFQLRSCSNVLGVGTLAHLLEGQELMHGRLKRERGFGKCVLGTRITLLMWDYPLYARNRFYYLWLTKKLPWPMAGQKIGRRKN